MIVHSIALDFFRNYVHLDARFSPEVNVIYGENAQGKTNLLEAVAYLSTASSHRARYDRELIQFGVDHAFVKAEVSARGRDFTLEARLGRGVRRQLYSNGVRLKSAGELSGVLNTVLFCPEDLYLIREGAATRRRFLDGCICQLRPKYAEALAEYRRLYEHKVRILRDWEEHPSLLTPPIHLDFSGGREELGLAYETVSTVTDPEDSPRSILHQLLAHQESHRKAELESRQCLSGPHKDDLTVELNGMSAKTFASQGQTRTAALSLKLASREIFYQETGEWPVLLLDDVLSELDARRQEFVLRRINGGQVFITCCEDARLEGLEEGKVFHIHGGALKP